MIFGLLKRKFFAIDEDDTTSAFTVNPDACSPRKRVRVEEPTSINKTAPQHSQPSCAAGKHEGGREFDDRGKEKTERIGELKAKLKEHDEMIARIKKESGGDVAAVNKLKDETMICMVCQDLIQNPQFLQCGHSACYSCLRSWWTQPLPKNKNPEMIDTVAESDLEDEEDENATERPRVRRRHKFQSVVKCKKFCPYCNAKVTSRPIPDLWTRDMIDTLSTDLLPLPPTIQAKRQARLTRRNDIWHGIFSPDNVLPDIPVNEPVAPPAPPPPHSDPILNDFAQAQFRRAAEEVVAARERRREKAFQDGWTVGYLVTMSQLEREEARQAAIAGPRARAVFVFGGGHPPPPRRGVGAAEGVPRNP